MSPFQYGFRSLKKSPGFVAVALGCLTLALGLITTTYAVLDSVMNPRVPFDDPDQLYSVMMLGNGATGRVTWFDKYVRVRDRTHFFEEMALTSWTSDIVQSSRGMHSTRIASASANFFSLLGLETEQGRLFAEGIAYADDANRAVISFSLWRRLYATGDIRGEAITIGDRTYEVIGVAPPGMSYPARADVWTLLPPAVKETGTGVSYASPIGRLRPGVTPDAARMELFALTERLVTEFGNKLPDFRLDMFPVIPDPAELKSFHAAMAGAALAVFLIACANLANLMLARGISRRREVALQMALGATRRRIIKQVLAESALIAMGGGVLGIIAALWGIDLLTNRMPPNVTYIGTLAPQLSWRVFVFGLSAITATVLLCGLLPAIRASNVDASEPLKDNAGTTTERMRGRYNALVMAEVAATMVLLMGAGLLLKAAERVGGFEFGYEPRGLVNVFARAPRGTEVDGHALLRRVQTTSGVLGAARWGSRMPDGMIVTSDLSMGGGDYQMLKRSYAVVSPTFLRTLGIPILSGRDFAEGDDAAGGAVIVSAGAARTLWPGMDPVGRRIKLGRALWDGPWLQVVGVSRNAELGFRSDPDLEPESAIFVVPPDTTSLRGAMVVRFTGDEGRVILGLTRTIADVMSGLRPILYPWAFGFDDLVVARRFGAGIFGLFGAFGLGLAAVGIYGVLVYAVSRRMREFGVRIALGAKPRDLLNLVLHDGFVMVLAGTGIGAFLAMWGAQIFGTWLYDVNATDALSLVVAEGALLAVSLVACVVPGLQAMRANPIDVLRAT